MNALTSSSNHQAEVGLERLIFFSDAVIAIAITLVAIDIRLPDLSSSTALGRSLLDLWPRYLSFAISFAVIGMYWVAHHSMFLYIQRFDRTLIWLNLVFLAWIAFTPFPTAVVGEYGSTPLGQIFYAGSVAATGIAKAILWYYASHRGRLLAPDIPPSTYRYLTVRGLVAPVVFLLSIPFAFVNFAIPIVMWSLSPLLYALVKAPAGSGE